MLFYSKEVGFSTYLELKRVEEMANNLGFAFASPKHHGPNSDFISLVPINDEAFPLYTRDAQLFTGTLGEVETFLTGLLWARAYDKMLKVSDEVKRERKEQDYRNKRLVSILKQEQQD